MKRVVTLVCGGLLALGLVTAVPTPAHAGVKVRGNLKLSAPQVRRGETVTLRGWLPPKARRTVIAQRRMSWGWSAIARGRTRGNGTFTLTWAADVAPGPVVLRAIAPRRIIKRHEYKMIKTPTRRLLIDPGPVSVEGDIHPVTMGSNVSNRVSLSADGRYVVLYSFADNLVPGDTNGYRDTFLYDRELDTLTKLTAGNGAALTPSISGDGQWVSFYSGASNLVVGDRNHTRDVFLYEVATGTTTRVTNGNAASYAATKALSGDGRYLTFWSDATNLVLDDTNGRSDVFVYDRVTATTTRIAAGNNHSQLPSISDDGRHVAFESYATNLAPEPDTNQQEDVFVYDVASGLVSRLTNGNGPSSAASISADGSAIGFTSAASNLVPDDLNSLADVFVWQRH